MTLERLSKPKPGILLIRTDKIGDLILTTPAIRSLRDAYPGARLSFLCRSYAAPILENNPAVNEILLSDAPNESFSTLLQKIRAKQFDAAIHFYCENRSVLLTALARVPVRIGPFSKPAAILLNRRVRQNRSEAKRHEAEYNLELVAELGADSRRRLPEIVLTQKEKEAGLQLISKAGASGDRPVLIHPGSAGSAKNWPMESYLRLADKISEEGSRVIFTTGPGEGWIADRAEGLERPGIGVFRGERHSLRELAGVIANGRLMISNSTGPLHMAVALGIPTCSFYPMEPAVTSPTRWGPLGDPATNIVLTPEPPHAPMASIPLERALAAVRKLLGQA